MSNDPTPTSSGGRLWLRVAFWFILGHLALVVVLYSTFWLPYREPQKDRPRLLEVLPESSPRVADGADPEPTDAGWVDREAGIVQIPVEEAMAIVAGRLPVRKGAPKGVDTSAPPTDAGSGRPVVRPEH